jgi:hypothetical protein
MEFIDIYHCEIPKIKGVKYVFGRKMFSIKSTFVPIAKAIPNERKVEMPVSVPIM